jgi:hypothetical protein
MIITVMITIIIMIIITICKLALLPDNPVFTPAFDVISVFFHRDDEPKTCDFG